MPAIKPTNAKPKTLTEHLAAQAPAKPVSDLLGLDKYFRSADLLEAQVRGIGSARGAGLHDRAALIQCMSCLQSHGAV